MSQNESAQMSLAEFTLAVLVAAGKVSQEVVDKVRELPGAPEPMAMGQPTRQQLRALVDAVWNECTESVEVPSTALADRIIDRVFAMEPLPDAAPLPAVKTAQVLHSAVAAIYFDDASKFKFALGTIVRTIDPDLAGELLSHPKAAYDIAAARCDAAMFASAKAAVR